MARTFIKIRFVTWSACSTCMKLQSIFILQDVFPSKINIQNLSSTMRYCTFQLNSLTKKYNSTYCHNYTRIAYRASYEIVFVRVFFSDQILDTTNITMCNSWCKPNIDNARGLM